jgi:putative CocE/NonD family hydrolase
MVRALDIDRRQFLRRASAGVIGTGVIATSTDAVAGRTKRSGVEFETSDGVTLVGDIIYPTDSAGEIADGPFPVVLSMSPYTGNTNERTEDAYPPVGYLAEHGYLRAVFDVRGTGSSGGSWRAWGPREQRDYVELIHWMAERRRSTGKVGLLGASYLGYNQLLAAGAIGSDSPLEALFPIVAAPDVWRTVFAPGGLANDVFNPVWWGGSAESSPASLLLGVDGMSPEAIQERLKDQIAGYYDSNVDFVIGQQLGTNHGYREEYWRERSATFALPDIVANDIPVFHYTGLFDLFQPESIELYTELQNLWAGRDQYAPMNPGQEVTGRYQAAVGPYMHSQDAEITVAYERDLAKRWFDRFLKGTSNGIDETETPLHIFQTYGNRWVDAATWPLPETTVESFYLDGGKTGTADHALNDGWLRSTEPAGTGSSDTLHWRPTSSPCQQAIHEMSVFTMPARDTCGEDNREWEATALTYTSEPFDAGRNLAGPSSATIYARANTPQTSWVVSLSDVAPDGSSRQLAYGALLGSFRSLNEEESWYLSSNDSKRSMDAAGRPTDPGTGSGVGRPAPESDGKLVRPRHDFTRQSEKPVTPEQVERYDILLTPMFARIRPDHRLRLTVQTTAPWATPAAKDVGDLVGGVYQVQRNDVYPSRVNVPFAKGPLGVSPVDWGECYFACGESYQDR